MDTKGNKNRDLDAEEMVSLARRYYAARFPNPLRLGCWPSGEIINVVRQRQIPDHALMEHLFECSECFGEYRQALAQCRPAPVEVSDRKRPVWILILKISAPATAVLILSSLFIFNRLNWRKPAPEAGNGPAPTSITSEARTGAGGVAAPNQTAAGAIAAIPKAPVDALAMVGERRSPSIRAPRAETIDVDLDNYQAFRQSPRESDTDLSEDLSAREGPNSPGEPDRAQSGEKAISLPAKRASLALRLPETGVPGKYNVSLINAFGQPLLSTSAFSPDGSKLEVALDLRRISTKKCRLRLLRKGEAPAFYDVIIGAR
jgi:hypothetical protein